LRPYRITSGPAVGPTCSKILAPPLVNIAVSRVECDAVMLTELKQQHVVSVRTNAGIATDLGPDLQRIL